MTSPNQSTLDIFLGTETLEMPQKSTQKNWKTLTSWLEDSHVKHSLFQDTEEGSMTQEELSFLKSLGFVQKKNQDIYYWKMLKVSYLTLKAKLSRQCLGYSPNWGMMLNGKCLTAKTLGLPKIVKGCTLKDILEPNVEEKYYLSKESAEKLMYK